MEEWPPATPNAWRTLVKKENLTNKTIHNMDFHSASKFQVDQYLMLRVLWKPGYAAYLKPANFGLAEWVNKASEQLKQYESWKRYCASFGKGLSEGTFALAQFYQEQVSRAPETNSFQSDVAAGPPSPISRRTRSQKGVVDGLKKMTIDTPSKAPSKPPTTPRRPLPKRYTDSDAEDESSDDESPLAPNSCGPQELLDLAFPKTKDEQIVNTALIDFLNAFVVHHGSLIRWTLYRKPFAAEFAKSSIRARTDGCLEEVDSGDVHALVEVKPLIRTKARFAIPMQEAAQMVAWIKTNPDPKQFTYSCGRRLHISQDRHQIWIIFAEYDKDYVRYLENELGPNDDPGFLTMHQFGPWDIGNLKHMKDVGKILLAISLRAEEALKDQKTG